MYFLIIEFSERCLNECQVGLFPGEIYRFGTSEQCILHTYNYMCKYIILYIYIYIYYIYIYIYNYIYIYLYYTYPILTFEIANFEGYILYKRSKFPTAKGTNQLK